MYLSVEADLISPLFSKAEVSGSSEGPFRCPGRPFGIIADHALFRVISCLR